MKDGASHFTRAYISLKNLKILAFTLGSYNIKGFDEDFGLAMVFKSVIRLTSLSLKIYDSESLQKATIKRARRHLKRLTYFQIESEPQQPNAQQQQQQQQQQQE